MGTKTILKGLNAGSIEAKVKSVSCANFGAFNTAFTTTSIATKGYGAIAFILTSADNNSGPDYVFSLYESNTSVTDAGARCQPEDVIVYAITAAGVATANTKCPATTGVLTMTHNDDEDLTYVFAYKGNAKWVRLQATVGSKTNVFSCTVVKTKARAPMVWG